MSRVRRGKTVQQLSVTRTRAGRHRPARGREPRACGLRLVESAALRIQEAALTGESDAIQKIADSLDSSDLPLGDRRNMAYIGTVVAYGRGTAVVVATGMSTELGKHRRNASSSVHREATPLQRQTGPSWASGWRLAALVLVALIFVIGLLRGEDLRRHAPDRGQHGGRCSARGACPPW